MSETVASTRRSRVMNYFTKNAFQSSLAVYLSGHQCCGVELNREGPSGTLRTMFLEHIEESVLCDVLVVSGPVTKKYLLHLRETYESMAQPKWVFVVGSCALKGGLQRGPLVVEDLSQHLPIDVFVPGCPVNPADLEDGLKKLSEIIKRGR